MRQRFGGRLKVCGEKIEHFCEHIVRTPHTAVIQVALSSNKLVLSGLTYHRIH